MKIIPAIDIINGKCVQLISGKRGTEKYYGDPIEIAVKWENVGAEVLHVIDLDATFGRGNNVSVVLKIKKNVKIPINFGGGIRDVAKANSILESGIDRIILGTLAINDYFNNFKALRELTSIWNPGRIIIALDSKNGSIIINGWQESTIFKVTKEIMKQYENFCWGFLYTNVDVEGQMKGLSSNDINEISRIVKSTNKPVIISGGITTDEDIENILKTGAWGIVLGKALYENSLDFRKLIKDVHNNTDY